MAKPGPKSKFREAVPLGIGGMVCERQTRDLIDQLAVRTKTSKSEVVRRLLNMGISQLRKEAAK